MFDRPINTTSKTNLHVFDVDGVLYELDSQCYNRFAQVAGRVIQQHTGIQDEKGAMLAFKSYNDHYGDAFLIFKEEHGDKKYRSMHDEFNLAVQSHIHGFSDPELPKLILQLSQFTNVCFVSQTTRAGLIPMLFDLKYAPCLIKHAYGFDQLGENGFTAKSDPNGRVFEQIAKRYGIPLEQCVLLEDNKANIDKCPYGTTHLITSDNKATDVVRRELQKFIPA